jgi:hypothetical protein
MTNADVNDGGTVRAPQELGRRQREFKAKVALAAGERLKKIGELTVERDFLAKGLGRAG